MKKWIAAFVLAAVAAMAVYFYLKRENGAESFRTAPVERGDISDTITATGNIAAVTTVSVGSQISGTIRELYVDYNSRVRKGQVIARIDTRLLEAAVLQARGSRDTAKAAVERAKVTVADTERTYRRNLELLRDGFVAQSDVDSAQTAYDQAVATLKSAEASVLQATGSLAIAETNLEHATIHSPVDGIVISRSVDVGQTVAASFQTPTLFSIAQDLTKMQIDTNVDESDIGRAAPGQAVEFTVDAWPDRTFKGVVSQVRNAPIVTQNVVTYNVVILFDNRDLLLKPGMTANVTIQVRKYEDILKIPNAALRFRLAAKGDGSGNRQSPRKPDGLGQRVYRLGKDNVPSAVPVKTGVSDGSFTALLSGDLREGDALIIDQSSKRAAKTSTGGSPLGAPSMRGFR